MSRPSDQPAPAHRPEIRASRLTAIGLICGAVLCFSLLDASVKWLTTSVDPLQAVFARYAGSMLLVALILNPVRRPQILRTRRAGLQAVRSLLLMASTVFNFIALQTMQLAETVTIMFATPLIVALVSGPLLGEWPGPRRLVAIAIGFLGVLVVTRPGTAAMQPAAILVMGSCVSYAFYTLSTRVLAAYDPPETTMLYSGVAGTVLIVPLLPWFWTTPQDGLSWALMLATGVFGGFGHWLLILAHRLAPAMVLAPFIYSQIVWMVGLGWLVFGQLPDAYTFVGAGIVVGSGLYLLYRERVRAKPEGSARMD